MAIENICIYIHYRYFELSIHTIIKWITNVNAVLILKTISGYKSLMRNMLSLMRYRRISYFGL